MRTRLTLARVATVLAVAAVAIAMSAAPALASNLKVSGKPPAAFIGQSYEAQLSVTGGTAPYTFTIAAGALPEGLELTPAGTIEGVPAQSGTAVFTVQVTDSSNPARSGSKKLKIKVGAHTFLSGEWQLEETRPNGEFAGREDGTLSATKASASMVKGNDFSDIVADN